MNRDKMKEKEDLAEADTDKSEERLKKRKRG